MLRYWGNHGCFLDSTQEGRRAIRGHGRAVQEEAIGEVEELECVNRHPAGEVAK